MKRGTLYKPPAKRRKQPPNCHTGPERRFQVEAINYVRMVCAIHGIDKRRVMHVPNGGGRNAIEAVNLKRQGTVAGYPDIMVFRSAYYADGDRDYFGLAIELKVWPGKTSPEQDEVHDLLRLAGWRVVVAYSIDTVEVAIREHLAYSEVPTFQRAELLTSRKDTQSIGRQVHGPRQSTSL